MGRSATCTEKYNIKRVILFTSHRNKYYTLLMIGNRLHKKIKLEISLIESYVTNWVPSYYC